MIGLFANFCVLHGRLSHLWILASLGKLASGVCRCLRRPVLFMTHRGHNCCTFGVQLQFVTISLWAMHVDYLFPFLALDLLPWSV